MHLIPNRPPRLVRRRVLPIRFAAVLAAAALVLAACGGASKPAASSSSGHPALQPVTIQLALIPPKMIFMGFYVAQAEGFYTKNGLNVTLQAQPTGDQAIRGLAAGVGVFAAGGGDAVAAADAAGLHLRVIWAYGTNDLSIIASAKVPDIAALAGKTIGVTDKSGPSYTMAVLALQSVGLSPNAAHYVILAGRPALVGALASGRIDAAVFHVDDGLTVVRKTPGAHLLAQMVKVVPDWFYGPLAVEQGYALAHPQVVRDLLTALIEAQRWMYANPQATITLAEKYTQESPATVRAAYQIMSADHNWVTGSGLSATDVNFTLNAFKRFGVIPTSSSLNYSNFTDPQFVQQVLAKLGPG